MLIVVIAVAVVVITISGFAVTYHHDFKSLVLFNLGTPITIIGNGGEMYGFAVYKNMTNVHISGSFVSNGDVNFVIGYVGQNLTGGTPANDGFVAYYVWSSGNTTGRNVSFSFSALSNSQFDVVYEVGFIHGSKMANNGGISNDTYNTVAINVTTPIVLTYYS